MFGIVLQYINYTVYCIRVPLSQPDSWFRMFLDKFGTPGANYPAVRRLGAIHAKKSSRSHTQLLTPGDPFGRELTSPVGRRLVPKRTRPACAEV